MSGQVVLLHLYVTLTNEVDLLNPQPNSAKKEFQNIVKISAREDVPFSFKLVFQVNKAPVKLSFFYRSYQHVENQQFNLPYQSYIEQMGRFEPRDEPYQYSTKDCPLPEPGLSRSLLLQTLCYILDGSSESYIARFFLNVKPKSMMNFLGNSSNEDISKSKTLKKEDERKKDSTKSINHWSYVRKQMLPKLEITKNPPSPGIISPDSESRKEKDKKSAGEVVKELGYWLYSSNVVQYFSKFSDEKSGLGDIKNEYSLSPIWMLGISYTFNDHDDQEADDEEKRKIQLPSSSSTTSTAPSKGLQKSKEQKRSIRRYRSVSLPKKKDISVVLSNLKRYHSLGDAFSIRSIRHFSAPFGIESIRFIKDWLISHNYKINWYNEFNLEAEENGLLKSMVLLRFYSIQSDSLVDINVFSSFKKSSMITSLLSGNIQTLPEFVSVNGKSTKLITDLVDYMEKVATKSEIIFCEGYNTDVTENPQIQFLDSQEDISYQSPTEGNLKMEGELLKANENSDYTQWEVCNAKLCEGVLTLEEANGKEGSSIPFHLAAVRIISAEDYVVDVYFNSIVYRLKAHDEEAFQKWIECFKSSAGIFDTEEINKKFRESMSELQLRSELENESVDMTYESNSLPTPLTPMHIESGDEESEMTHNQKTLVAFLRDFHSVMWFTYRKDFPKIDTSIFSSDVGWGCMLRTAQMLLGHSFVTLLLSRDWRIHKSQSDYSLSTYKEIISWFADLNLKQCYYSLHNMSKTGRLLDKKIGEWFGPCTAAYVLRRLSLVHPNCPITIHVNTDNTIYCDLVSAQSCKSLDAILDCNIIINQPVLILLPIRLGIDKVNDSYHENLKLLFTLPQFMGIAGGKPCKSLYFVATQDDELFYLDPHILHPFEHIEELSEFPLESYHCETVRRMKIKELDPSMLIGFLIRDEADFRDLIQRSETITKASEPIFTIHEKSPNFAKELFITDMELLKIFPIKN